MIIPRTGAAKLKKFRGLFVFSRQAKMELDGLERKTDEIDDLILSLMNERTAVAAEIGRLKGREGMPPGDIGESIRVLNRVAKRRGILTAENVESVFRHILEEARRWQRESANDAATSRK